MFHCPPGEIARFATLVFTCREGGAEVALGSPGRQAGVCVCACMCTAVFFPVSYPPRGGIIYKCYVGAHACYACYACSVLRMCYSIQPVELLCLRRSRYVGVLWCLTRWVKRLKKTSYTAVIALGELLRDPRRCVFTKYTCTVHAHRHAQYVHPLVCPRTTPAVDVLYRR